MDELEREDVMRPLTEWVDQKVKEGYTKGQINCQHETEKKIVSLGGISVIGISCPIDRIVAIVLAQGDFVDSSKTDTGTDNPDTKKYEIVSISLS